MQHENFQPGGEVELKDGRQGVLYALTQNNRNPLARDVSRPANWYFLPNRVGTQGMVVIGQPCTVSVMDIERRIGHRAGNWPAAGHVIGFEEKQRVYVAHMQGMTIDHGSHHGSRPEVAGATGKKNPRQQSCAGIRFEAN